MTQRSRLIFLGLSLGLLVAIGAVTTGSLDFILVDFWFTSGLFLLVLLALVDQPHFSKDANIFANGVTAWVSLLLVPADVRAGVWWVFLAWATYLIVSSYVVMLIRRQELADEPEAVQIVSRLNRQVGRPEAIFSALFLWGVFIQFGAASPEATGLFLYWAAFMILNVPAIARVLDRALRPRERRSDADGSIHAIISPLVAEARLTAEDRASLIGQKYDIVLNGGPKLGSGVAVDDRLVAGARTALLAIDERSRSWGQLATVANGRQLFLRRATESVAPSRAVSYVDAGSAIGRLVFRVHPETELQSGEVVSTSRDKLHAFYQVISAEVREEPGPEDNAAHVVRVTAGELGNWNPDGARFEPVTWVAPAGQLVFRAEGPSEAITLLPGCCEVGHVPNSTFPVYVTLEDVVTHNTALIGVTGSGKSFLAFHLIEAIAASGIKVLILDVSRQHDIYLRSLTPTALKVASDVAPWITSDSRVGIYQFASATSGFAKATADFIQAAFDELSKAPLERGKNLPARLCIGLEEAHSLIPEWNQVAQEGDKSHVNRTSRVLLQGRKYGMGAMVVTQRTANVTKTILNQCNTIIALQSFDQTGLDFLRNYMGEEYAHAISTLPTHHAILVGKASSSARPVLMRVVDMTDRWRPDEEDAAGEGIEGVGEESVGGPATSGEAT